MNTSRAKDESGVRSIAAVPDEWPTTPLGALAKIRSGYGFPPRYQGRKTGDLPFYKVSDMNSAENQIAMTVANNYIDASTIQDLKATPFPKDSVIFPKIGATIHTNKKRILSTDALIDNNVMSVSVADQTLLKPRFLLLYLHTVDLSSLSNQGTVPSITSTRVKELRIPVPPIVEQERICNVLVMIQQAIGRSLAALNATKELKKSLMKHLFRYGPVPPAESDKVSLKETEMGTLPSDWRTETLGELTDVVVGHVGPVSKHYVDTGEGIPLLSTKNITQNGLSTENLRHVDSDFHRVNKKSQLFPGDIMVARHGNSGLSAVIPDEMEAHALNVVIIRRSERINSNFLSNMLNGQESLQHMRSQKSGSVQGVVNTSIWKRMRICLPALDQQLMIDKMIRTIDRSIVAESDMYESENVLFDAMLRDLMTGKLRVNNLEVQV